MAEKRKTDRQKTFSYVRLIVFVVVIFQTTSFYLSSLSGQPDDTGEDLHAPNRTGLFSC